MRRPSSFEAGTVSIVPMRPPMLNQLPAVCFQLSTSSVACAGGNPAAASDASPVATTEMNALQLHHVIRATTAISSPLIVMARYCGVKSSAIRGGAAWLAACFQRSGSFTNSRTRNATAAGSRPKRNT